MLVSEIRKLFLDFFAAHDHAIVPSSSLVPKDDPTLLFTSAGMVQFKTLYSGLVPLPYRRAASCQKCLRVSGKDNDLDEVGRTSRHCTFFEMLGNFSFGDYFKKEAIRWGWDLTRDALGIPEEMLWATIFEDDDEAFKIWRKDIGLPENRILRMGAKDNFWGPAGGAGACGPCSEILVDRGKELSSDSGSSDASEDSERFVEIYNMVFPSYDQQEDGSRPPLKNRGIDTGMGLERVAAIKQGAETVFDIDVFQQIIRKIESVGSASYSDNPVPYRIVADHTRAVTFLAADGVLPSNEGRGYVQRMLLRRAARQGRRIGIEEPFMSTAAEAVIEAMGPAYPELGEQGATVMKVIAAEENRFRETMSQGLNRMDEVIETARKKKQTRIPGEELFRLYDTYGFPLEVARDIAEENGFEIDQAGFDSEMQKQRERARAGWVGGKAEIPTGKYGELLSECGKTRFAGYESLSGDATVQAILVDGEDRDRIGEGENGEIVLDVTPFYAEAGGQVGDRGVLRGGDCTAEVLDCQAPVPNLRIHRVHVPVGILKKGDQVRAEVDVDARNRTMRHHTATHLLHASLHRVLGDHARQSGSLVAPDRLRFDFSHFEAITGEELDQIQANINQWVRENHPVHIEIMKLDDAKKRGAMALFGEKYGDEVRTVGIKDISLELCGGAHVCATGDIGFVRILGESSIAAGVRRIEAVCGEAAESLISEENESLKSLARMLKVPIAEISTRVQALLDENKRLIGQLEQARTASATGGARDLASEAKTVCGVKVVAAQLAGQDRKSLKSAIDRLKEKLGTGIIVLGSPMDGGKVALVTGVTRDLTDRFSAIDIVSEVAGLMGGGGGGRPDLAEAGGKDPEKLPEAIDAVPGIIEKLAKS